MRKNIIHIFAQFISAFLILTLCVTLSSVILPTTNTYNIPVLSPDQLIPKSNATEPATEPVTTEPIGETEPEPEFLTFSPNITFDSDYIDTDGIIPYAIFTPSCANDETKSALIIWLHGAHDIDAHDEDFMSRYFPGLMSNWPSEGFNAYVICPQLIDEYKYSHWCTDTLATNLRTLISHIMSDKNIDPHRVYLTGASLGGQGTIYHSIKLADIFAKSAALSGYGSQIKYSNLEIPMLGIVGKRNFGEDSNSINFMRSSIKPLLPESNFIELNASHGDLPEVTFTLDLNNNNRSDIIEWLFSDDAEFNITAP